MYPFVPLRIPSHLFVFFRIFSHPLGSLRTPSYPIVSPRIPSYFFVSLHIPLYPLPSENKRLKATSYSFNRERKKIKGYKKTRYLFYKKTLWKRKDTKIQVQIQAIFLLSVFYFLFFVLFFLFSGLPLKVTKKPINPIKKTKRFV